MKLSIFFLAALLAYAAADCSVTVKQTLGSAWTSNGQAYSQWNAQLVAGSEAVTSVTLSITGGDLEQLWELVKEADGSYRLPDYRIQNGGIVAGQVHQFGYIIKTSAQATITVTAKSCGSSSPSASPAAPSASTSPAAPSASASPAAPSPSSSAAPTIVATPQPSLTPQSCTMKVTQTTRTTADGHWTSGDFQFQIYDLVITNNGSYPITQGEISFQLAGDDDVIYQFWNLQREAADIDVFVIPTAYGPIQVGASQGAGYIVRSPLSAGKQTAPGFIPGVATCNYGTAPSASPSPSASASPSPSSSAGPIVSTPQPSPAQGCAAKAALVARSEAQGGKWDDGAYSFQIYDLTINNAGSKPINGAQLTFTLASGTSISQWWELNQVSAAVFNVAFNYGNLQVGASQGAGVVERYAKGTTPDAPTVALGSVTCA